MAKIGKSTSYHHGDLRAALISAGRAILEESGPKALTMREAARRANVSHAAPQHHFSSLRSFLGDCAADGFDEFNAHLMEAARGCADPRDAMEQMGRSYVAFAHANRAVFRLMFDRDTFYERTKALQTASATAYATLVQKMSETDPEMSADQLGFRVASVWSLVHGFAGLLLEGKICQDPNSKEDVGDYVVQGVRSLLKGFAEIDRKTP